MKTLVALWWHTGTARKQSVHLRPVTRDTGEKVTRWIISQHFYATAGVRHKKMFATKTARPFHHPSAHPIFVSVISWKKYLLPQVTKQRVLAASEMYILWVFSSPNCPHPSIPFTPRCPQSTVAQQPLVTIVTSPC